MKLMIDWKYSFKRYTIQIDDPFRMQCTFQSDDPPFKLMIHHSNWYSIQNTINHSYPKSSHYICYTVNCWQIQSFHDPSILLQKSSFLMKRTPIWWESVRIERQNDFLKKVTMENYSFIPSWSNKCRATHWTHFYTAHSKTVITNYNRN